MTNTLHRQGTRDGLAEDFIIFLNPAKGINSEGAAAKIRAFFDSVVKYRPVNLGDGESGNIFKTSTDNIRQGIEDTARVNAVFTDLDTFDLVLKEVKDLDLGLSANVSGLVEEVARCGKKWGIIIHSVEQSLGYRGQVSRLPNWDILEISTMCGHGMVSFNFIKKVIDHVKLGKLTPAQGAKILAKPCECGVFNPLRAEHILARLREMG